MLVEIEHPGVKPNITTMGEAVASGMPLSAVLTKERNYASIGIAYLRFHYGENPASCAAALPLSK